jgi:hypothetical protein
MLWWIIGFWLASGAVIPVLWLLSMASRRVFVRNIEAEQRQSATPASAAQSASSLRWLTSSLAMWVFKLPGHHPDGMRVAPNTGHIGQYVLSALTTIGALILLFVSSFSDSSVTRRDLPPAAAVAHAPVAPAAVAETRALQSPASAALSPAAQLAATPAPSDTDTVDGEASRGLLRGAAHDGDAEHIALIESQTGNAGEHASDDASRPTAAALPQSPAADALLTAPVFRSVPGAERGPGYRRAHGPSVRPYATTPSSHGTWLFPPALNAGANS